MQTTIVLGIALATTGACSSKTEDAPPNESGSAASAGMMTNGGNSAAGAAPSGGAPNLGTAGGLNTGGATAGSAGAELSGGSSGAGAGPVSAGAAGEAHGGSSGSSGSSGATSMAGGSSAGAAGGVPDNCNLPVPVSFQKSVQPFLTASCGKSTGSGCHVTDGTKTSLGYNHAYDWITAIAHTGSCGKTPPYAKRFEVILAVINAANPPSCPNSRKMPPPGSGGPPTACEIAALRAWLAEPMVSQMHVPETDETKTLYPPGPYLMPPFN